MNFDPYEKKNLIFIDTEFTDLDPDKGEILSIGILKLSGEELYLELEFDGECSDWVTRNVIPLLKDKKVSRGSANKQIREFIGDEMPFAIAFVDNYDVIYLTKIFGAGKLPFKWVSIDFASVLFALGINPVKFVGDQSGSISFYKKLGIDYRKYNKHHALDDARLLKDVWIKMLEKNSIPEQHQQYK